MSEPQAIYATDQGAAADEQQRRILEDLAADPLLMFRYHMERRRAIITELRFIEEMYGLPQSIPRRRRPGVIIFGVRTDWDAIPQGKSLSCHTPKVITPAAATVIDNSASIVVESL